MKRIFIILSILSFHFANYGQNEVDALRYSFLNPTGTARYTSLGGAMGALGGDLSAVTFNPAGIALFRGNSFSITPVWVSNGTETNYYKETHLRSKYKLELANIGVISSTNPSWGSGGIELVNFGVSYTQLANFNRNVFISGFNNKSSLLDIETKKVINGDDNNLFKKADLIYTDPSDSTKLTNDFWRHGYGAQQSKNIRSEGNMGEYTISTGLNFNNRLYIGVSLGIIRVNYTETSEHTEDPPVSFPDLLYFNSKNYFKTTGGGMNLKVGVIGRITDWLRLGAAIHTPTVLSLEDVYNSEVNARIDYQKGITDRQAKINTSRYKWKLRTPFRANASAAFIWGKLGLLSFDYEFINYSSINMEASGISDYNFSSENEKIKEIYRPIQNLKIGLEYNLGPFSFRGGYAFLSSPFSSGFDNNKAHNSVYSGGIGLRTNRFFVDIAGRYTSNKEYFYLYGTQDSKAEIGNSNFSYLATIGLRF